MPPDVVMANDNMTDTAIKWIDLQSFQAAWLLV
jgi:hypothetical protein